MRIFYLFPFLVLFPMSTLMAANYQFSGDVRTGYFSADRDDRNGSQNKTDEGRLRIRAGITSKITESLEARVRFAGRYSTDDRNNNFFKLFASIPSTDGLRRGDSTLDEIYIKNTYRNGASVTFGRMQTKMELEGVAKKSLDRNNSPNTDISWTDGLYVKYPLADGWKLHAIMQYNPSSGATEPRRSRLNFSDSASRLSYFSAIEKKSKTHFWAQRGLDVTYLPSALQQDGTSSGRIADYWAVVGRAVARLPLGQSGEALMLGGELGVASKAPSNAAVGLPGNGDAGRTAYQVAFNWVNFAPKHSVGLVMGRADAGWLLSPDYRDNTDLLEIRYKWIPSKKHKWEARLRQREDSKLKTGALKKREDTDLYLRYTYKF